MYICLFSVSKNNCSNWVFVNRNTGLPFVLEMRWPNVCFALLQQLYTFLFTSPMFGFSLPSYFCPVTCSRSRCVSVCRLKSSCVTELFIAPILVRRVTSPLVNVCSNANAADPSADWKSTSVCRGWIEWLIENSVPSERLIFNLSPLSLSLNFYSLIYCSRLVPILRFPLYY